MTHTDTDLKGREALEGEHKGELGGGGVCFYHEGLSLRLSFGPHHHVPGSRPHIHGVIVSRSSSSQRDAGTAAFASRK